MQLRLSMLVLASVLAVGIIRAGHSYAKGERATQTIAQSDEPKGVISSAPDATNSTASVSPAVSYRIIARESKFMAHVNSSGLLWFLGHSHHIAIRDFTGEARLTPGSVQPASLQMTVNANSLEETGAMFTAQQKQIINGTMRKQVLETEEYPEIVVKSVDISGKLTGEGQYQVRIGSDLTLHGVTRHVVIPAQVSINGNRLRATGEFSVKRSDYQIKTESIKWGTIRVSNKIRFVFDIVADQA